MITMEGREVRRKIIKDQNKRFREGPLLKNNRTFFENRRMKYQKSWRNIGWGKKSKT